MRSALEGKDILVSRQRPDFAKFSFNFLYIRQALLSAKYGGVETLIFPAHAIDRVAFSNSIYEILGHWE